MGGPREGRPLRYIQVEDGLRVRFPGRSEEFAEGVEVGLLAAALASERAEFTLSLARTSLEQARALAERFGYRLHVRAPGEMVSEVTFLTGRRRPRLFVVASDTARRG